MTLAGQYRYTMELLQELIEEWFVLYHKPTERSRVIPLCLDILREKAEQL